MIGDRRSVAQEVLGETLREPLYSRSLLIIDAMDNGMFRTCFRFEKEDTVKVRVALRILKTAITAQRGPILGDEALFDNWPIRTDLKTSRTSSADAARQYRPWR
ncbi:hypothetical protein MRX96_038938 [Rhipicephalus microplus]